MPTRWRAGEGGTCCKVAHFEAFYYTNPAPPKVPKRRGGNMETRTLTRPKALAVHEDEGCWDLVCAEAGDE